jgi:SulP family sulfate permease
MAIGLLAGTREGYELLAINFYLPEIIPFGLPSMNDFSLVLLLLVLPQIPMTVGNAVVAYADLSRDYYGEASARVTYRNACLSMAVGNALSFLLGGMPLCHGAGGLAAHYRFGARTAGSNLIIGFIFLVLALFLGTGILAIVYLIPLAVLGVLLLYAGSQLCMTMIDLMSRKDLFVAVVMLGITLATNLAIAFLVGLVLAYALKSKRMSI